MFKEWFETRRFVINEYVMVIKMKEEDHIHENESLNVCAPKGETMVFEHRMRINKEK